MNRSLFVVVAAGMFLLSCAAKQAETIDFANACKLENEKKYVSISGYLAVPERSNGPGVVVLHAWWGLTEPFRQVCDRLEQLRDATGADELIITTITHGHADRVRSYELLAAEWQRRGG